MQKTATRAAAVGCAVALWLGCMVQASADESGLVELTGAAETQALASMKLDGRSECWSVIVAKASHVWALVGPTDKCGPNSGHSVVYKKVGKHWKYMFYDMQNDGCTKYHVPAAVKEAFSPWLCWAANPQAASGGELTPVSRSRRTFARSWPGVDVLTAV